jgi:hypothetical protein
MPRCVTRSACSSNGGEKMRCGLAGDQKKSSENKKEAKNQPW